MTDSRSEIETLFDFDLETELEASVGNNDWEVLEKAGGELVVMGQQILPDFDSELLNDDCGSSMNYLGLSSLKEKMRQKICVSYDGQCVSSPSHSPSPSPDFSPHPSDEVIVDDFEVCSICLCDKVDAQALPCGHFFHNNCIETSVCTAKTTCPNCRCSITTIKPRVFDYMSSDIVSAFPLAITDKKQRKRRRTVTKKSTQKKQRGVDSVESTGATGDDPVVLGRGREVSDEGESTEALHCNCTGGCKNARCVCVKEMGGCSSSCRCTNCVNPFLLLEKDGVVLQELKADECFMQNLQKKKPKTLLDKLNSTAVVPCCHKCVSVKEVVMGYRCDSCNVQFTYSWCTGLLCDVKATPRNHCSLCRKCGDYRDRHCDDCGRCYFAGAGKNYDCPCKENRSFRDFAPQFSYAYVPNPATASAARQRAASSAGSPSGVVGASGEVALAASQSKSGLTSAAPLQRAVLPDSASSLPPAIAPASKSTKVSPAVVSQAASPPVGVSLFTPVAGSASAAMTAVALAQHGSGGGLPPLQLPPAAVGRAGPPFPVLIGVACSEQQQQQQQVVQFEAQQQAQASALSGPEVQLPQPTGENGCVVM